MPKEESAKTQARPNQAVLQAVGDTQQKTNAHRTQKTKEGARKLATLHTHIRG